jgi:hypothetical protein
MSDQFIRLVAFVGLLTAFVPASLAWQERTVGGETARATVDAPNWNSPKLNLDVPDVSPGEDAGTEIRIPASASCLSSIWASSFSTVQTIPQAGRRTSRSHRMCSCAPR